MSFKIVLENGHVPARKKHVNVIVEDDTNDLFYIYDCTGAFVRLGSGGGGGGITPYASHTAFPAVGKDKTLYLATDTTKIYFWTGTAYQEIVTGDANLSDALLLHKAGSETKTGLLTLTAGVAASAAFIGGNLNYTSTATSTTPIVSVFRNAGNNAIVTQAQTGVATYTELRNPTGALNAVSVSELFSRTDGTNFESMMVHNTGTEGRYGVRMSKGGTGSFRDFAIDYLLGSTRVPAMYVKVNATTGVSSVGIGTEAPSRKLEVAGDFKATTVVVGDGGGLLQDTGLFTSSTTIGGGDAVASGSTLVLTGKNFAGSLGKGSAQLFVGNLAGSKFQLTAQDFAGGSNNLFTVLGVNGNVGIGTGTPTQKLDVAGNGRFAALAGTGVRTVTVDENGVLGTGAASTGSGGTGSSTLNYRAGTASETLQASDDILDFVLDGSNVSIGAASGFAKKIYRLKNSSTTNVNFTSTNPIDGVTSSYIIPDQALSIYPATNKWIIL